jgi:L-amino acid N-acyltransferase YncA
MLARQALPADVESIARIYNQGIEDRVATFETQPRSAEDIQAWFDGIHPLVVVEEDASILAFAAARPYRSRQCYRGVADVSVYVDRQRRGRAAGRLVLEYLIAEAARGGYWKLIARIFVENVRSRKLVRSLGFREVGIYEKHGRLDGTWRDCVIVERLIAENLT